MTRRRTAATDWPRVMREETAARYCDEVSVGAFRKGVGTVYPAPVVFKGRGERWLREDLDQAIDQAAGRLASLQDASDVL